MKLAASNIAWLPDDDERVSALLQDAGFSGVEIAPTRYWADPSKVSLQEAEKVRRFWSERKLPIIAMQSLLFARPTSALFGSDDERSSLLNYLANIVSLGSMLGARVLVFGSPRNRTRGALPLQQALNIAIPFFRQLGDAAAKANVIIGIEPNPEAYNCDFVTNTSEGVDLVAGVNHESVRLHLDAGALALNGEDVERAVNDAVPYLCHVHCSEPNLRPIGTSEFAHSALASALNARAYPDWVSVEMRAPEGAHREEILASSMHVTARAYGA